MQRELRIPVEGTSNGVSALLVRPADAHALYVLAHGAGADMHHAFMAEIADRLARVGVATMRYQFPYTEHGSRRIDRQPLLLATVRAAVDSALALADGLPIVAGGKSMGGRMTSLAAAAAPLPGVRGLVFLGFPLHPAGEPATTRAEHLAHVSVPTLFVQGTRDALAELELLRPVLPPAATLHVVAHADHGFAVLVRSGRKAPEVMAEIAAAVDAFVRGLPDGPV
ncbi:MAG TPA: alpha/beta family hydrolase [Nannocystaceae bacterium]|nr:alpha/beta family hydrolase [Nannocystaceae bacterium]